MLCGDPVGSTDPEVILWDPQILRWKRNTIPSPYRHVKCLHASFWRSNAHWCTFWAFNAHVMHVSGVERQFHACCWRLTPACLLQAHSWRSAPGCCLFLAFSARMVLCSGVERRPDAPYWRWTPARASFRVKNFFLLFLTLFLIFFIFFVTPHDHVPN